MEDLSMSTRLNVRNLADLCGCFHALVWDALEEPIKPIEVLRAIATKDHLNLNPFPEPPPDSTNTWTRQDHVHRIAWFVMHGWDSPIEVDVKVVQQKQNFYCGWPVVDGLHRVAAALVRLDKYIDAVVVGSLKDHLELMATSSIGLDDLQLDDFSSVGSSCPSCGGEGGFYLPQVTGPRGSGPRWGECLRCNATGRVYHEGAADPGFRDERGCPLA